MFKFLSILTIAATVFGGACTGKKQANDNHDHDGDGKADHTAIVLVN